MNALKLLLASLIAAMAIHISGVGHHTAPQRQAATPQAIVGLTLGDHPCGVAVAPDHVTKKKGATWHPTKHKKKKGAHPSKYKPGKHKPGKHKPGKHPGGHSPQPYPKKIPQPHLTGPPGCR